MLFAGDELELAQKILLCNPDHRLAAQAGTDKRRYERLFTSDAMALRHGELYAELFGQLTCWAMRRSKAHEPAEVLLPQC